MYAHSVVRNSCLTAALLALTVSSAPAATILFIGNSFTFADRSPVHFFHSERVTDLNHEGIGGMPALFKSFTLEAAVPYDVSLETSPGKNLDWHFKNKADVIGKPWDIVVMHGFSTLDAAKPGDPGVLIDYTKQVAALLHEKNPSVETHVDLDTGRPDLSSERALVR